MGTDANALPSIDQPSYAKLSAGGRPLHNRLSGESRNPEWSGTNMVADANALPSIDQPSNAKLSTPGDLCTTVFPAKAGIQNG